MTLAALQASFPGLTWTRRRGAGHTYYSGHTPTGWRLVVVRVSSRETEPRQARLRLPNIGAQVDYAPDAVAAVRRVIESWQKAALEASTLLTSLQAPTPVTSPPGSSPQGD